MEHHNDSWGGGKLGLEGSTPPPPLSAPSRHLGNITLFHDFMLNREKEGREGSPAPKIHMSWLRFSCRGRGRQPYMHGSALALYS